MIVVRDLLARSWRATKRRIDVLGETYRTHASAAGEYLELAGGDARRAIAMLPKEMKDEKDRRFWSVVAAYLALLDEQERNESTRKAG